MTLKSRYINMRNSGKLDAGFLYDHFKENGGRANMNEFMQAVNIYQFTDIWGKLDSAYQINSVHDAEGNFLKAF